LEHFDLKSSAPEGVAAGPFETTGCGWQPAVFNMKNIKAKEETRRVIFEKSPTCGRKPFFLFFIMRSCVFKAGRLILNEGRSHDFLPCKITAKFISPAYANLDQKTVQVKKTKSHDVIICDKFDQL